MKLNKITCTATYVTIEKLNDKPLSYMSKRMDTQLPWKEKEANTISGELSVIEEILQGVKIKSRKLSKTRKKCS